MKKFVAGFVAAILLTSSFLFVYADDIKEYVCTKVKYDILVDGEVYKDDNLPALVYEGNTYLPVRNFCNLLGADVEWNDELQQAEISTVSNIQNYSDQTSQTEKFVYLKSDESYDNGDVNISLCEINASKTIVSFKVKVVFNKDRFWSGTLTTGYYITDNELYNTEEGRLRIFITGRSEYGKEKTMTFRMDNEENYNITGVCLSFPSLGINNLVWKIVD
ncbi:stalk domain-containing protein [Vallitalea guaymasensis]|uniref:Copper amine oxidase-like N-terminal domain-containing protein n=1 Tax=Vallitalea guaymasensis TaxID=1185412 RepID=A0A8J8MBA7_9FIRM|nr:stalk domain-containing protein [Vallitalea guaymasensis]QUH29638.1 hypothetical protein HYG85_12265 [Vallitalea guaymasensis]